MATVQDLMAPFLKLIMSRIAAQPALAQRFSAMGGAQQRKFLEGLQTRFLKDPQLQRVFMQAVQTNPVAASAAQIDPANPVLKMQGTDIPTEAYVDPNTSISVDGNTGTGNTATTGMQLPGGINPIIGSTKSGTAMDPSAWMPAPAKPKRNPFQPPPDPYSPFERGVIDRWKARGMTDAQAPKPGALFAGQTRQGGR